MKSYEVVTLHGTVTAEDIDKVTKDMRRMYGKENPVIVVPVKRGANELPCIEVRTQIDRDKVAQSHEWCKWIKGNDVYGQIDTRDLVAFLRSQGIPVTYEHS